MKRATEPFAGSRKIQMLVLHHELDMVTALAAGETFPAVARETDTEAGMMVIVHKTACFPPCALAAVVQP